MTHPREKAEEVSLVGFTAHYSILFPEVPCPVLSRTVFRGDTTCESVYSEHSLCEALNLGMWFTALKIVWSSDFNLKADVLN